MLDLFSGGAMASFSIAAMGVYPYITASVIMQLLVPIIPRLTELSKEGESGRNQINQYTHWLTVPLAALQAYGTPQLLNASLQQPVVENFGFDRNPLGTLSIVVSMTAGTMLLIWFGELITQHGRGNGVSVNIFGGNVARAIYETFNLQHSWFYWFLYFWLVVAFTFFYAVVLFQQQNIHENLQRQGGFIPGIRPGPPTARYLYSVLMRITLAGAVFLGVVAVLPFLARNLTGTQALTLSATALLIVVGVGLDTMRQLEAQLIMRNYRGFIR